MTATLSPDMIVFYRRYDRKLRRLMAAALGASLLLSAIMASRLLTAGGLDSIASASVWRFAIGFTPLFTAAWWIFTELMALGRRRATVPDWRLPTTPVDSRNARRIANAGFVFTLGLMATQIANQALTALLVFGHPIGYPAGEWVARATMVIVGGVTIYLGNVWPRMPTPRAPELKPAFQMKAHRLIGWFMVLFGLGIVLFGLSCRSSSAEDLRQGNADDRPRFHRHGPVLRPAMIAGLCALTLRCSRPA